MRRLPAWVLSLVLLTGCASTESGSAFSSADLNFAEMMIPHHEQALEMSEIALTNSSDVEVIELATQIRDAQAPEIEEMSSWPGVNPKVHMGHFMDGMLTKSEIEALRKARGIEFDRLFLRGMIKHHEGAIEMAQEVIASKNSEVGALASAIINAQESEIKKMRELLSTR
jgi:uncharacterized protein (DUF305 family)